MGRVVLVVWVGCWWCGGGVGVGKVRLWAGYRWCGQSGGCGVASSGGGGLRVVARMASVLQDRVLRDALELHVGHVADDGVCLVLHLRARDY